MAQLQKGSQLAMADILGQIVGELHDWIMVADKTGRIIYVNQMVYNACKLGEDDVLGNDLCMFVGVDLADDSIIQHIQNFISNGERFEFVSNRIVEGNRRIYLANTLTTVWNEDGLQYYICISKDITNTEELKEEVYRVSYFDTLTHFPNQKVFIDSVLKQVKKAKKHDQQFAIILLDIKKMNEINSVYGMNIADQIIKEVGRRIKSELDSKQEVFKYNGNVFAIIYQNVCDEKEIIDFLSRLRLKMEEPIHIHNSYMYIKFKAGIALYSNPVLMGYQLIEQAQIALTKVKMENQYGPYLFYNNNIEKEVSNSFFIEKELLIAVQNDEFIVHYQPFVDLSNGKLAGMEALLRRKKKNGEIIYPGQFIELLEKLNLIEKVGMSVLEKVCAQLRDWTDKGYEIVPVSVNLSGLQFKDPNLAKKIKEVLEKYQISTEYIVLEITETAVMEDVGIAQLIIEELKRYGFSISIDDFGTGYASIGYLKKFMFDHLKIDISFIRQITSNMEDRAIVEAIIAIAKTFNLKTIAEGIESEEQREIMKTLGCELGQGYYWNKPISAEEIEKKYFMVPQE